MDFDQVIQICFSKVTDEHTDIHFLIVINHSLFSKEIKFILKIVAIKILYVAVFPTNINDKASMSQWP